MHVGGVDAASVDTSDAASSLAADEMPDISDITPQEMRYLLQHLAEIKAGHPGTAGVAVMGAFGVSAGDAILVHPLPPISQIRTHLAYPAWQWHHTDIPVCIDTCPPLPAVPAKYRSWFFGELTYARIRVKETKASKQGDAAEEDETDIQGKDNWEYEGDKNAGSMITRSFRKKYGILASPILIQLLAKYGSNCFFANVAHATGLLSLVTAWPAECLNMQRRPPRGLLANALEVFAGLWAELFILEPSLGNRMGDFFDRLLSVETVPSIRPDLRFVHASQGMTLPALADIVPPRYPDGARWCYRSSGQGSPAHSQALAAAYVEFEEHCRQQPYDWAYWGALILIDRATDPVRTPLIRTFLTCIGRFARETMVWWGASADQRQLAFCQSTSRILLRTHVHNKLNRSAVDRVTCLLIRACIYGTQQQRPRTGADD